MVACGKKEEPITEVGELLPLDVELTVTESVEIGETVEMKALVTQGDEKIEDANEVEYEIWEEGKKSESISLDSKNEKGGIYTAETSFDHAGTFHIQVHVTARGLHTMPTKIVTVGDGGNYEESEGHDYHTEGFSMHFMKPTEVEAGDDVDLVVHIELHDEPLENLNVRYEIWNESNPDKHDWVPAEETASGEYRTPYSFTESETYSIVIHVEDDEELHEHEEHEIEVGK